jgi:hypothetical protein
MEPEFIFRQTELEPDSWFGSIYVWNWYEKYDFWGK